MRTQEQIDELRARVNRQLWWQSIELGDGIVTQGMEVKANEKEAYMHLDEIDYTNASVLDIGGSDGKYSFQAERGGAQYVVSVDNGQRANNGFYIAKEALGSGVIRMESDFLELKHVPIFTVVLFLGVLYHLQDPMAGLRKCVSLMHPDGVLVVESALEGIDPDGPTNMMFTEHFYPSDGSKDPTNWWYPSRSCLEAMMRAVGLVDVTWLGGIANRGAWTARKGSPK